MSRKVPIGRFSVAVLAVGLTYGSALGDAAQAASPGQSPWSSQINSKVRLVSGTIEEQGGPTRYAGVQLRMKDGWKTYWRNPGDSGVPPTFDWSGSTNLESVDVLYPVPHRFSDANGTAIGYDDEVVFPIRLTPKRADKPIQLSLTFDYGLCKDLCIPNSVDLEAIVPADIGRGDAVLIEQASARVPATESTASLPRLGTITAELEGPEPNLEIEAIFAPGATNTDVFVTSAEVLIPVPKVLGPLQDGRQRFSVSFSTKDEAQAIKGKPLTVTLVSDQGSSEAILTRQ